MTPNARLTRCRLCCKPLPRGAGIHLLTVPIDHLPQADTKYLCPDCVDLLHTLHHLDQSTSNIMIALDEWTKQRTPYTPGQYNPEYTHVSNLIHHYTSTLSNGLAVRAVRLAVLSQLAGLPAGETPDLRHLLRTTRTQTLLHLRTQLHPIPLLPQFLEPEL